MKNENDKRKKSKLINDKVNHMKCFLEKMTTTFICTLLSTSDCLKHVLAWGIS